MKHCRKSGGWIGAAVVMGCLVPVTARADIAHFELDGKIYNKFLFANDDSQGTVWLGNPFWFDNFTGSNGQASEFELGIRATVSKYVKAHARLQSRWGADWHDWWENGDIKEGVSFPGDTSGESLGMNHAQYIKLRGFWIEAAPPIRTVESIRVGASDLSMFNPWTIGRVRYIDRDNARGIFVRGKFDSIPFNYEFAATAPSKEWGGPGWNLGNNDPAFVETTPFITQDWAYGLKLQSKLSPTFRLTAIGSYLIDREFNENDPDTDGSAAAYTDLPRDGAVDFEPRFQMVNGTLELNANLGPVNLYGIGAYSASLINPDYTTNGVSNYQGFFPVVWGETLDGELQPVTGQAAVARADITDPFGIGLSFQLEGFDIGSTYNTMLGARREADVLLTDGFVEGGQLPTLNVANEFQDWDEPWFESCIGWKGVTLVPTFASGTTELKGEFTLLGYNTNMQGRDVDTVYPGFLYPGGFTDTDFYDYANATDRGRDFRAVYREFQDRHTQIYALWASTVVPVGRGLNLGAKLKYVHDLDGVDASKSSDDYEGKIGILRIRARYQLNNELMGYVGDEINRWVEDNRPMVNQTPDAPYPEYFTRKNKVFAGIEYNFAGLKFTYLAEWVVKTQHRGDWEDDFSSVIAGESELGDLTSANAYHFFNRIRTKATLEASW